MGRKGRKRQVSPSPPGPAQPPRPAEWMAAQAERLEKFSEYMDVDDRRHFWSDEDLYRLERFNNHVATEGLNPRLSLPPPARISREIDCATDTQKKAWQYDFEFPKSTGIRPAHQPSTPKEEIATLVAGKCTALGFCPSTRAVMICGRPVVVPTKYPCTVQLNFYSVTNRSKL